MEENTQAQPEVVSHEDDASNKQKNFEEMKIRKSTEQKTESKILASLGVNSLDEVSERLKRMEELEKQNLSLEEQRQRELETKEKELAAINEQIEQKQREFEENQRKNELLFQGVIPEKVNLVLNATKNLSEEEAQELISAYSQRTTTTTTTSVAQPQETAPTETERKGQSLRERYLELYNK